MEKRKLSKIRISKKVLRKQRGSGINREINLASLGGIQLSDSNFFRKHGLYPVADVIS